MRPSAPPARPVADLAERVPTLLGWTPAAGEPRALRGAGGARARQLACRGEHRVVLCEAAGALPDRAQRARLFARLAAGPGRALLVFADAAHREQVWSWRVEGAPRREWSVRAPGPDAAWAARLRAAFAEGAGPLGAAGEGEVLAGVAGALGRGERAGDPVALRELVEGEAAGLRRLWRALLATRALDPACGRGSWLLAGFTALRRVYEACLESMEGRLEDARRAGRSRGALADFRAVLERADDPRAHADRRAFVGELILLRNLYGVGGALGVEVARRRLLRAAGGVGLPAEALHLRAGRLGRGGESAPEDEVELLARAEGLLWRMRLEEGLGAAELREGVEALARRRARLAGGPGGGGPAEGGRRRLDARVEFAEAVRLGGFTVVRGARR